MDVRDVGELLLALGVMLSAILSTIRGMNMRRALAGLAQVVGGLEQLTIAFTAKQDALVEKVSK